MEETWKTELLQRPPSRLSLREQLTRLLAGLAALPGKAWTWLTVLVASGELWNFFFGHLSHLLGLVAFLALLGWSTRRLRRLTSRRFQDWRARGDHLELLPIYLVGAHPGGVPLPPGLDLLVRRHILGFRRLGLQPGQICPEFAGGLVGLAPVPGPGPGLLCREDRQRGATPGSGYGPVLPALPQNLRRLPGPGVLRPEKRPSA